MMYIIDYTMDLPISNVKYLCTGGQIACPAKNGVLYFNDIRGNFI